MCEERDEKMDAESTNDAEVRGARVVVFLGVVLGDMLALVVGGQDDAQPLRDNGDCHSLVSAPRCFSFTMWVKRDRELVKSTI